MHSLYVFLLTVSGAVSLMTALAVWRRRQAAAALPLFAFLLALSVWAFTYALFWSVETPTAKSFWLDATYFGVVSAPVTFLVFALACTHHEKWLSPRYVIPLCIVPGLVLVSLWTDPYHGLFYGGHRDPNASQIFNGGPAFWLGVVYLYALNLIAVILLVRAFFRAPPLYRRQAQTILLGVAFPVAINLLTFLNLAPLPGIDLTPIAFTIAGLFFVYALFYYRFLDIVPVARDRLLESISEGVIVLDNQDRVVDVNPAARKMLDGSPAEWVGEPIERVCPDCLAVLLASHRAVTAARTEIYIPSRAQHLDLQILPLRNRRGKLDGWLLVAHDVTELKHVEGELRAQLARVNALQAELQEQAIRDPLTNLFNRRYFQETFDRELARARRAQQSLCVILADIDHFKDFNDTYGHAAGDAMLCALADMLQNACRAGDIVCRYGGEEFAILLLDSDDQTALRCSENWRSKFQALRVRHDEQELRTTFSAGLAMFPAHGTTRAELMAAADAALYLAKARGRNCTVVADAALEPA